MKKNLETKGLMFEIVGLTLILFATIWQATVTDWFDKYPVETRAYSNEIAHTAILNSIGQLALASRTSDISVRNDTLDGAHKIIGDAHRQIVRVRNESESLEKNQGYLPKLFRIILFLLGALLIIIGKLFMWWHKSNN